MKRNLIIFSALVFVGIAFLLFRVSGYEFPNENKFPEIPFFPKTTKASEFVNNRIDSMYIRSYEVLDKSNLILLEYYSGSMQSNTTTIALVTKSFIPVFNLRSNTALYYSLNNQKNVLFIVDSESDRAKQITVFNIEKKQKEVVKNLTSEEYHQLKNQLEVVKHYTTNQNYTEIIFFVNKNGQFYLVNDDVAAEVSKDFELKESENFDFAVSIVMAGNHDIKSKNITLFDNTVVSNQFKRLLAYPTPSSPGGDGNPNNFPDDRGWFDKSRYYFFKIKLKNVEAEFKNDLYYNSEVYFDELTEPKTDQDTLLYYSQNKFYQFYKK